MKPRPKAKSGLVRMIAGAAQPVYAINARRQIVYCNPAMGRWLGVDEKQLVGLTCHYHSRTDAEPAEQTAAALCPPPTAFHGAFCYIQLQRASIVTASGRQAPEGARADALPQALDAWCNPLPDGEGNFAVLVVCASPHASSTATASDAEPRPADSSRFDRLGPAPAFVESPLFATPETLHRQLAELRRQAASIYRLERLIGVSDALRHVRRQVAAAIASGANATILGPSHNACQQIARTIHYSQYPSGKAPPLIPLDCANCDAEMVQGALRHLHGERTYGQHGRLLLSRVDQMPLAALRELSEFVRLPTFELGLLATAEESLQELARRDAFDAFLASHLGTIAIYIPPLADRLEDIPLTAQAIVEDYNAEGNHQLGGLTPDVLEMLYRYPWPDDTDELERVIYEACQNATGTHVTLRDLPAWLAEAIDVYEHRRPMPQPINLETCLQEVEDELMRRAMRAAKGNKTQAARLLGISRQRMIRWAEIHGSSEQGQGQGHEQGQGQGGQGQGLSPGDSDE